MKRFKNILYHADGDLTGSESLGRAVNLARRNDARLTVMDVVAESELPADVQQLRSASVAQMPCPVSDKAPKVITNLADEIDADSIVMDTVGRTGLPGLIIGNTAEDVLQTTRTSILVIKPEGFVSPVCLP